MTTKKQTIEKANEPAKEVTLNAPAQNSIPTPVPAMSPAPMTMAAAPMAAPSTDATEDQLPAQNNFEFVRALDAKGESILINKADLVKVLEGLMGYPIGVKGEVNTWNTTEPGIYKANNPAAGTPPPANMLWGLLIVIRHPLFGIFQIYHSSSDGVGNELTIRSSNTSGSNFGRWNKISFQ